MTLRLVVAEQARRGRGGGGGTGGGSAIAMTVAALEPLAERDAVATLIESLRVRLLRRQARLEQGAAGEAAAAAPGCALTPDRDEIADEIGAEDGKPAPGFEGRTVNGWVI